VGWDGEHSLRVDPEAAYALWAGGDGIATAMEVVRPGETGGRVHLRLEPAPVLSVDTRGLTPSGTGIEVMVEYADVGVGRPVEGRWQSLPVRDRVRLPWSYVVARGRIVPVAGAVAGRARVRVRLDAREFLRDLDLEPGASAVVEVR
jgi:hypothetical protein